MEINVQMVRNAMKFMKLALPDVKATQIALKDRNVAVEAVCVFVLGIISVHLDISAIISWKLVELDAQETLIVQKAKNATL